MATADSVAEILARFDDAFAHFAVVAPAVEAVTRPPNIKTATVEAPILRVSRDIKLLLMDTTTFVVECILANNLWRALRGILENAEMSIHPNLVVLSLDLGESTSKNSLKFAKRIFCFFTRS